jgi:hypothetical protein
MKTTRGTANIPESQRHTEAVKLRLLPEDAQKLRAVAAAKGMTISALVAKLIVCVSIVVVAALATGCSAPVGSPFEAVTAKPSTLTLDAAFSPAEVELVHVAFAEWPTPITTDLTVYRVSASDPHADVCQPSAVSAGLWQEGRTSLHADGSQSMCLYLDTIAMVASWNGNQTERELQFVAVHESGHVHGLPHYAGTSPSVMRAVNDGSAYAVQTQDLADLAALAAVSK